MKEAAQLINKKTQISDPIKACQLLEELDEFSAYIHPLKENIEFGMRWDSVSCSSQVNYQRFFITNQGQSSSRSIEIVQSDDDSIADLGT